MTARDCAAELAEGLGGIAGRMLAAVGLPLVEPDGRSAANSRWPGALATHPREATGRDFATMLLQDEEGRLFWASDHRARPC